MRDEGKPDTGPSRRGRADPAWRRERVTGAVPSPLPVFWNIEKK
jgi:hypothetical protein